jgi:two-component system, chemotaxis family, protein-glutamate methylesterase/glutaminase
VSAIQIVALGASLGGLQAVQTLLRGIPAQFGCSLVLAQHRRPDPDSILVELLAKHCAFRVIEPEDKTPLEPNTLYVAPGDYHMLVEDGHLALSIDAPVCYARPSIDVLFESVANAYRERAIGIVLTGANEDGAAGLAAIKAQGGVALVQDPASAARPTMPAAALAATVADAVLPLEQIPPYLHDLWRRAA